MADEVAADEVPDFAAEVPAAEMELLEPPDAFDPAIEAHKLLMQGKSWREIAQEAGYASAHAARQAVRRMREMAIAEMGAAARREALDLELARLDALQTPWWPLALLGDEKAATLVLKIMNQRGKWLGFEAPDAGAAGPQTLVIVGDTAEEYIARLQQAVDAPVAVNRDDRAE